MMPRQDRSGHDPSGHDPSGGVPDGPTAAESRRWVNRSILGGVGLLILAGGIVGAVAAERYWDFRPASAEFDAAEREYRAQGLPWVATDLAPQPPIPFGQNAAGLVRAAMQRDQAVSRSKETKTLEAAITAEDWPTAGAYFARFKEPIAMWEAVATKPRADFGRDLDLGPAVLYPELAELKNAVKTFGYRARYRAATGDLAGARADLRRGVRIAALADSDAVLISLLVSIAGAAIVDASAQRAAASNPKLAGPVASDLIAAAPKYDLVRALRSEAYNALAVGRNIQGRIDRNFLESSGYGGGENGSNVVIESDPKKVRRSGAPGGTIPRAYMTRAMQVWTEVGEEMKTYPDSPLELGRAIDSIAMVEENRRPLSYELNKLIFPVFSNTGQAILRARASRTVTLAYLRALETRQRTGAFPKVFITGKDPFGHAYVGKREGKGFRIYSLGPDGTDEGGLVGPERNRSRGNIDDIGAVYPPPKPPTPGTSPRYAPSSSPWGTPD